MLPISQRTYARFLAVVCGLWLGLVAFRTRSMAEMIGTDESEVRALGVRDLGSAIALLAARDPRGAIALRAGFDLADAARYGRGRPKVLAMTAGFAAVGALGLLARRP